MKKVILALLAISLMVAGVMVFACGETDPAEAPKGSQIQFVGGSAYAWNYGCIDVSAYGGAPVQYVSSGCDLEQLLEEGDCGATSQIVTAFVSMSEGTSETSTTGTGSTGGRLSGTAMNDIEVRFIVDQIGGGLLYKISDNTEEIGALPNPYVTRTDDRGLAEVKFLVPYPMFCGATISHILSADIGVSKAFYQIDFTVEDPLEEEDDTTTE